MPDRLTLPAGASVLERIVFNIDQALAPLRAARMRRDAIDNVAEAPAAEPVLGRAIGVAHLGRWIEVLGDPASVGPRAIHEPSLVATAGRLVGFHPDEDPARSPSTRILVLLAGTVRTVRVRVDETVVVAPRDWS